MNPYKVVVIDDSAFMRKIISDLIEEDPQFTVIGTAKNGAEGIEKIKSLQPDIATLDVEMPVMNGIDALREIMQDCPLPVLMLSSLTDEGAEHTLTALELGAVDFVKKPSGNISLDLYKTKHILHEKLHAAAQTQLMRRKVARRASAEVSPVVGSTKRAAFEHLVAIGTSTGGPKALQRVISSLPADFCAPVLIVQHMPPRFTLSLAQRLDGMSRIEVTEAQDGEIIRPGKAYIAPGGWHMTMEPSGNNYVIRLDKGEPVGGHRPSVDRLFHSLIPLNELKRHAVLMTGMGSDGARGMLGLKEAGAMTTIAEAEQSCIVYGMPRSAVEMGAADHILPLDSIAGKLVEVVEGRFG